MSGIQSPDPEADRQKSTISSVILAGVSASEALASMNERLERAPFCRSHFQPDESRGTCQHPLFQDLRARAANCGSAGKLRSVTRPDTLATP